MLGLALSPDVVLVSSARRTLQTLEALEPWEDTPLIEPMDALYLATAPQLLEVLAASRRPRAAVLLIGHNPGLHDLAVLLMGEAATTEHNATRGGWPRAIRPGPWPNFRRRAVAALACRRRPAAPLPVPARPAASLTVLSAPVAALDLALAPEAAARLPRLPEFSRRRAGRARRSRSRWCGTTRRTARWPRRGLALCEAAPAARPRGGSSACAAGRSPCRARGAGPAVAEAPLPAGLPDLPAPLLPVAAFSGTLRTLSDRGRARAAWRRAAARDVARRRGRAASMPAACSPVPRRRWSRCRLALAGAAGCTVPAAALAAEAHEVAGRPVPPRALGAPELPAADLGRRCFCPFVAHLACVLLHWAPLASVDGRPSRCTRCGWRCAGCARPSAVPPRRRRAGAGRGQRRSLARSPRCWGRRATGTCSSPAPGTRSARAFRPTAPSPACWTRRSAGGGGVRGAAPHLDSPAFRLLGLRLACLALFRPGSTQPPGPAGRGRAKQAQLRATPLTDFAAHALPRRLGACWRRARPSALRVEELHAIRIHGKRLRYAAEFFAPLFPRKETRRFLRRLAELQERWAI